MKEVFRQNDRYRKIDEESLKTYLKKWKENKETIYKLFSKQECWNADELALVIQDKIYRNNDANKARNILNRILRTTIYSKTESLSDYFWMIDQIITKENASLTQTVWYSAEWFTEQSEHYLDRIMKGDTSGEKLYSYLFKECHLSLGMKLSRAVTKMIDYICNYFKVDYKSLTYTLDEQCKVRNPEGGFSLTNNHTWEQAKAKLCDYLNPLTVDETFYISINPLDYLTMSHGTTWDSCHSLRDDGCYHSATGTTLADGSTVIVYTLPKDETPKNNFYKVNKQTRQMLFLADDLTGIFQQVFYPSRSTNDGDVVRNILQEMIAKYKNLPNLWTTNRDDGSADICTDEYLGYKDWEEGKPSIVSVLKGCNPYFEIGASIPCIDDHTRTVYDHEHMADGEWRQCECCGEYIPEDDAYYVDGECYCCHCYEENFTRCQNCDDDIYNGDEIIIDGNPYCERCANRMDYKEVEDGSFSTKYITLHIDGGEEYFSSEEAMLNAHSDAVHCDECDVWYVGKCPRCEERILLNTKINQVLTKVEELTKDSNFYQYKDEFKKILSSPLSEEVKLLILKGDFNG